MKARISKNRSEVEVGCKYADNCFECPFPDCVLPMESATTSEEVYMKDRELLMAQVKYVKQLRDEGLSIRKIAQTLKCAEKTVKKDLIMAKTLLREEKDAEQN